MSEPKIPAQRWINNLLEAADAIANKQDQQSRWLAADRAAWESPDEAINTLDDYVLDGFVEEFSASFSVDQAKAVTEFRDEVDRFCKATPRHLDPAMVLTDARWDTVRNRATAFLGAFRGKWPPLSE